MSDFKWCEVCGEEVFNDEAVLAFRAKAVPLCSNCQSTHTIHVLPVSGAIRLEVVPTQTMAQSVPIKVYGLYPGREF